MWMCKLTFKSHSNKGPAVLSDVPGLLSGRSSPCPNLDVLCVLACPGIQTDSVLSARLQIIRIYIREDGRLVIEFKTHAKFRGKISMGFPPTFY